MLIKKDEEDRELNSKDRNQEHIDNILKGLEVLTSTTESAKRAALEEGLVRDLSLLSERSKRDNSDLLQPLHLYFMALYTKGRISLDETADNPSISLFTSHFLEKRRSVLKQFEARKLQKVIMTLILANLSIHRIQHAKELLDSYDPIFTEKYKAYMYIRLLNATCGVLDKARINELFVSAEKAYEATKDIDGKATFLYRIYHLSKGTLIDVPGLEDILRDFAEQSTGLYSAAVRDVYLELLRNNDRPEMVSVWLDSLDAGEPDAEQQKSVKELKHILAGREKGAVSIELSSSEHVKEDPEKAYLIDSVRRHYCDKEYDLEKLSADIRNSLDHYRSVTLSGESLDNKLNAFRNICELELTEQTVRFWEDQEKNYSKIVPDDRDRISDAVFIAVNEYSLVNASTTFPFLMEAKRRGIPCYSFSPKLHLDRCESSDPFYDLYGMVNDGQDKRYYVDDDISDAVIDIPGKRIELYGMNIYQPVFEIITRYQFTYEYRFDTDAWARYRTVMLIRKYKALFNYIREVEAWAVDNKKKVYFISNAPHIHNAAAFRIYCEDIGYKTGLNFICTSPGYDNYFLNSTDPRSLTTTAINMTEHLDCRNSFLGTKEGYEKYYGNNSHRIEEVRQKMQNYLMSRRGSKKLTLTQKIKKERILKQINKAHRDGKTVILLNGKVIIDLGVKYTKGCVHADMSEWITHAVAFANANSDRILLLVKPHPHENRQDLTMTSEKIEDLSSIIKTDIGKAVYLDKDLFTNFELVPYIDLGMVWNGTSAIEFSAQGKKVLIADEWGYKDYPIGFVRPETLEEYESYMLDPGRMADIEDLSDRAMLFLEYMGSDDVRVINKYTNTTLMNFNQYESTIDSNEVDEFVRSGNEELKKYFSSLL